MICILSRLSQLYLKHVKIIKHLWTTGSMCSSTWHSCLDIMASLMNSFWIQTLPSHNETLIYQICSSCLFTDLLFNHVSYNAIYKVLIQKRSLGICEMLLIVWQIHKIPINLFHTSICRDQFYSYFSCQYFAKYPINPCCSYVHIWKYFNVWKMVSVRWRDGCQSILAVPCQMDTRVWSGIGGEGLFNGPYHILQITVLCPIQHDIWIIFIDDNINYCFKNCGL